MSNELQSGKRLTIGTLIEDLKKLDPETDIVVAINGCDLSIAITNMIMAHSQSNGKKVNIFVIDKTAVLNTLAHAEGLLEVKPTN